MDSEPQECLHDCFESVDWTVFRDSSLSLTGARASSSTVKGAQGESVVLSPGIPARPDVYEIVWKITSLSSRIVQYRNGICEILMAKYKQRITLHPGNFSLEIRGLRRADAGDYEVTVTVGSGAETKKIVRLEVYVPDTTTTTTTTTTITTTPPPPNTTRAHKPQRTILLIRSVLVVIFLVSALSAICWVTWRNGAEGSSSRDGHHLQRFECMRKGRQPPEGQWQTHFSRERRN
ncbi:uncharacterized protein [Hemitrygon akajei]|uniref:uncharacterized protein isoform X2 n=1 Tax=Hemitrygon akajei TaxID=2704970 RepID=UPI003BF99D0D